MDRDCQVVLDFLCGVPDVKVDKDGIDVLVVFVVIDFFDTAH